MPTKRVNERAITATNHTPPTAAPASPPPSSAITLAIRPPERDHRQERHRPADIKGIDAGHLGERTDDVERQRRIIVDDQRIGRGIEGGRAHRRVGVIGVPAFVLRDLDRKAGAPYRPHHEIDGKQREKRDLRPDVEAAAATPSPRRPRSPDRARAAPPRHRASRPCRRRWRSDPSPAARSGRARCR